MPDTGTITDALLHIAEALADGTITPEEYTAAVASIGEDDAGSDEVRKSQGQPADAVSEGDTFALWLADLLNLMVDAGNPEGAAHEAEAMAGILDEAGVVVALGEDGRYVVGEESLDDNGLFPQAVQKSERAPVGGVTIGGKFYQGGRFIPSAVVEQASPEDKAKLEAAKEAANKKRAEKDAARKARPADRASVAAKLAIPSTDDATPLELEGWEEKQAAASARMIFRHHGELAFHRFDELADTLRASYDAAEDPDVKSKLARRMAALSHAMEYGEKWQGGRPTPGMPPAKPEIGQVYNVNTDQLQVDPSRFQYKLNTSKKGVTDEFLGVEKFNPDFAGVISVWKDPADGQTYVINGHHRHELASRLGHPDLAVRYVDAPDARTARAAGALINMAEGRGTAVDAAKFMRDTGLGPDDLASRGVSLKGRVAADAMALTALSDRQFNKLALGTLEEGKALAVARHLKDHALQDTLFGLLERREDAGKDLSPKVIEEMAKEMAATPKTSKTEASLFGDIESEESLFVPRNEVKAAVRAELASEVNDYLAASSKRRADRLAGAGNVLATDTNRGLAEEAARAKNTYDTLVNTRGPVSDAINAAAEKYSQAKNKGARDAAKREAVTAVREAIRGELSALERGGEGPGVPGGTAGTGGNAADAAPADGGGRGPVPSGLKPPEPGFTGTDANGHEWVDGKQVAKKDAPPPPDPKKVSAAQERFNNREQTAKGGGIFGGEYLQAQEGFAKLPDGARILYTDGKHAGKTGRIVHENNGEGGVHITTLPDGESVTVPASPDAVEPLDANLSWRTEQATAATRQEGLGMGVGEKPKHHPVDDIKKKISAVANAGGKGTVDGYAVEQLGGFGQWKVTTEAGEFRGTLPQIAAEIHSANEKRPNKSPGKKDPPAVTPPPPGKPQTHNVYRGTGRGFSNDHGVAGKGEYWSGNRDVAMAYAGREGKVSEGKITLERPLVMNYGQLNELQTKLYGKPLTGFEADLSAEFDTWLRKNGYDGVVLYDAEISTTVPQEVIKLAPDKPQ